MNRMKNQMSTLRVAAGIFVYTAAILRVAANIRKDITIHGKHGEHSPCACDKACLGCLFEG
jgi:hypothetical protein